MQAKWLLIVVGLVIVVVSALADTLGLGGSPGLGRQQVTGIVLGGVLALIGGTMARRATDGQPTDEGGVEERVDEIGHVEPAESGGDEGGREE